jgi:hypothetical protein
VQATTDKATLTPHKNLDSKTKERKTYVRNQNGLLQAQRCPVSNGEAGGEGNTLIKLGESEEFKIWPVI